MNTYQSVRLDRPTAPARITCTSIYVCMHAKMTQSKYFCISKAQAFVLVKDLCGDDNGAEGAKAA